MTYAHILSFLSSGPWAITPKALETMNAIVAGAGDVEALAAKVGKPLQNTGNRIEMRGNTAVLGVEGPLFRYGNLFTEVSGATSIEVLARDFNTALDNPQVHSILLNINSPGGQADGVGELAAMIHAARDRKPVTAYVGGLGASGGYWLAAACSKVVLHETAFVGSIGCCASATDTSARDEKDGIRRYQVISSQSPLKNVDVGTAEGRSELQEMVDAMAGVFIARVAGYRGTSVEYVSANYGKGSVRPASLAVQAGMADAVGSFEAVVAQMNADHDRGSEIMIAAGRPAAEREEAALMAEERQQPDVQQAQTEAVRADRARISAILNCEEAVGRRGLAEHFALETSMSIEAARAALTKAPVAAAAAAPSGDVFTEAMRATANPKVGVGGEEQADDITTEIRSIAQYLPASQRRAS